MLKNNKRGRPYDRERALASKFSASKFPARRPADLLEEGAFATATSFAKTRSALYDLCQGLQAQPLLHIARRLDPEDKLLYTCVYFPLNLQWTDSDSINEQQAREIFESRVVSGRPKNICY